MKVYNSIEVEHILPQNQHGAIVDWNNFLLSCKYCNTIKSDHNNNLIDYVWPDLDNTDLVFTYSEANVIEPNSTLNNALKPKAQLTIKLTGLDRIPGSHIEPTKADTRWKSRKETWDLAKLSFIDWKEAPVPAMARQIGRTALNGNYSIWSEVFKTVPQVLVEIDKEYRAKGLYKEFDANHNRIVRLNANI